MVEVNIFKKLDSLFKFEDALRFIKDNEVYIGIPQEETTREDDTVTNAELLFIHTNGSPVNHIPPRPSIEPSIKDDQERLSSMLKKSFQLSCEGKKEEAINQLKKAGMRGQNVARGWFTNPKNHWAPNCPAVKRYKERKGATNPRPLIDTGELRKSITYFVKTKEGRIK